MSRTYTEQMQDLANRYWQSGQQPWPATTNDLAAWAMDNHLWVPPPSALIKICAEDFARAMREEYFKGDKGRKVRVKHVARIKRNGHQLCLWADMRTASRAHMEIAFKQRREQIVGDCRQLKTDVDGYNENYNPGAQIPMIFDFTYDLEELDLGGDRQSA